MADAHIYAAEKLKLARQISEYNKKKRELEEAEEKISQLKQEIKEIQNNPFKSLDFNF